MDANVKEIDFQPLNFDKSIYETERKTSIKKLYLYFSPVILLAFIASVALPLLFLIEEDTFFIGVIFSILFIFTDYFLYGYLRKNLKLKQSETYFNITEKGIFFSTYNDISGGVNSNEILWHDIIETHQGKNCTVYFYKSGTKYSINYLSLETVDKNGDKKRNLIPIREINKFKNKWRIGRAILINLASLKSPDITFQEDVFYDFKVNPETFEFKKRDKRRMFVKFILLAFNCITIGASILACFLFSQNIETDLSEKIIFSLIVIFIFTSIIIALISSALLLEKVPFFKRSFPDHTGIRYR